MIEKVKRGRGRPKGTKGTRRKIKASKTELIQSLEERIDRQPDGCWVFSSNQTSGGHATLYYDGQIQGSAHRVAYEVWVGPIPPKGYVLQRCGNKLCCNPAHLYIGSFADIMRIRNESGRSIKGLRNPKAKLSLEQVETIRTRALAGEKVKELAAEFGVSAPTISQIKNGNIWRAETKAELQPEQIEEIYIRSVAGERIKRLAEEFGVTARMIDAIKESGEPV